MEDLVSVVIASRDRTFELARTLSDLASQDYRPLELVVVDDASEQSLEPTVTAQWHDAVFKRRETSMGQSHCRSYAFGIAKGKYVLQLDDDASLTRAGDLATAVRVMEEHPELGVIALYSYNGLELPPDFQAPSETRYALSFLGAGALFRRAALAEVGGYLSFFHSHWEEEELSIRMLKGGWAILALPTVVIHHRLSGINRRAAQTWKRGLRNQLWAMVIHMPLRRLPLELGWKLALGFVDAVKYCRPLLFLAAVTNFLIGIPKALVLRCPMSKDTLRRYDALRFGEIRTVEEWRSPPAITPRDLWRWFRGVWWHRPRSRPFWSRQKGDLGESLMNSYASIGGGAKSQGVGREPAKRQSS